VALGLGFNQPIRVRRFAVPLAGLPEALSPFRVLHFSDTHLGGRPNQENRLLDVLSSVEADLLAFTGDALYSYETDGTVALRFFRRLAERVEPRFGLHLVRGNHDNRPAVARMRQAGFSVLVNESRLLQDGSPPVYLVGVDDPRWGFDDLQLALTRVPNDAFTMLLAHSPDVLPDAAKHGIDIALAGHTHGGQIRLPWVGALVTRTRIDQRYAWGLNRYGDTVSHTTCGTGCSFPPIRLLCPQEVVLLELTRA